MKLKIMKNNKDQNYNAKTYINFAVLFETLCRLMIKINFSNYNDFFN